MTPEPSPQPTEDDLCATGIKGLDYILGGGLPRDRFYLVLGDPGVGKTTLSLQFLLEGCQSGERTLYITLSETKEELAAVAKSHGWNIDRLEVVELSAIERQLVAEGQTTLFHPDEVELPETTRIILDSVDRVRPHRVVLDSLSELRLLSGNALRYRRQLLALKQYFIGKHCTVLLIDDRVEVSRDLEAKTVAHGVIALLQLAPDYGGERRRLRVLKLRGVRFSGGYHDFSILRGGLAVYPRLIAAEAPSEPCDGQLASGIKELDDLLGGGLDFGTSNLIMGPAGTGKSVLATVYAASAAQGGHSVAVFTFDETRALFAARASLVGRELEKHLASGRVHVQQIDPAEISPGEFTHRIRERVQAGARLVIVDSINGYLSAMPDERHLELGLHELCTFCSQSGAATLMLAEQKGVVGAMQVNMDLTYLADTVLLTRHFEFEGGVRQAISVMKKRCGDHERYIRELKIDKDGVRVGKPLHEFHGVLTGTPVFHGSGAQIMHERDA